MRYNQEIYEAMKPVYARYLNNPSDFEELIEMVDSNTKDALFNDLCKYHGVSPSITEQIYEIFYPPKEEHFSYEKGLIKNAIDVLINICTGQDVSVEQLDKLHEAKELF